MKKIFGLLSVILFLFIGGCSESKKKGIDNLEDNYIWGTHDVYIDMYVEVGSQRGFNIPFAYTGEKDGIELIAIEGENVKNLEIKIVDDTIEEFNKVKIDEYKLGYLGVIFKLKDNEETTISKIKIKINDNVEEIVLANPIVIKPCINDSYIWERISSDAIICGINNKLLYSISSEKEIKIIEYGLTEPFVMSESTTYINDVENEVYEKEIGVNSDIRFEIISELNEELEYSCLGANFYIKYENEENNEKTYYFTLVQQGASDEDTGEEVLKNILDSIEQ